MKSIGFIISKKENEKRRPLVLEDIKKIKNKNYVYFEENYGEILGISNQDLINLGFKVEEEDYIINNCDIICDPKIGDYERLNEIKNKTIFGWIHATLNYNIAQTIIDNKITAYAWEKMFKDNVHVFYKNNELAGASAVLDAILKYGKLPTNLNVAIIGNGNTSRGAQTMLNNFKVNYRIFERKDEEELKNNLEKFDIIINCILWDVKRKDHIIYEKDLKRMRKGSLIIDVSCDKNGAIETSIPTTIENPIYIINGVVHYAVDHTPSLLYKDASKAISSEVIKYIDTLIEEKEDIVLENALIIKNGNVIDQEINEFQNR